MSLLKRFLVVGAITVCKKGKLMYVHIKYRFLFC